MAERGVPIECKALHLKRRVYGGVLEAHLCRSKNPIRRVVRPVGKGSRDARTRLDVALDRFDLYVS
jgi:hypothetical protein